MAEKKLPDLIYAQASVRSIGGVSIFGTDEPITSENADKFNADPKVIDEAVVRLRNKGFDVLFAGQGTINIAGSSALFNEVFNGSIEAKEITSVRAFGSSKTTTMLDSPHTAIPGLIDTSKSDLADIIEGVALIEPVDYMTNPLPKPPKKLYHHLKVPSGISRGVWADLAHRRQFTGRGVSVAVVDSGWYHHPFFDYAGYDPVSVILGPGASEPTKDGHGHGVGMTANLLAIAPDVKIYMVKFEIEGTKVRNAIGAFDKAISLNPDIISCSWGSHAKVRPLHANQILLSQSIGNAVRKGITVVFAAGNGGYNYPGQHPQVISAGGVFKDENGELQASNYASGFESQIYLTRKVPDVCGLVGQKPDGLYIMLPVQPGCYLDKRFAGRKHPTGDETASADGWACFSGTSSATAQIAGVCALMKQANKNLTPLQIRQILRKTARDIVKGMSNTRTGGLPAAKERDLATGDGLVDAYKAVRGAVASKVRRPGMNEAPHFNTTNENSEIFSEEEIEMIKDFFFDLD